MVALYDGRLALAALNHVGINGTLNEVVHGADLLGYLFKRADELLAYYLALGFGIGDALELFKEYLTVVHLYEVHAEAVFKHAHYLVGLVLSQEPVVDEHAGELVAHRLMYERCRNCGINAARHGAQHLFAADFCLKLLYLFGNEARHRPVAVRAAHII